MGDRESKPLLIREENVGGEDGAPRCLSLHFGLLEFGFCRRWNSENSLNPIGYLTQDSIAFPTAAATTTKIGRLRILGMLSAEVCSASSYDGYPGVVGSPGYVERN